MSITHDIPYGPWRIIGIIYQLDAVVFDNTHKVL